MANLELYRIFKIVAEENNITSASKKLNISQPAVSKHIKNLEEELNIILFERTNKGLKLTKDGKEIFNEIRKTIEVLENIENKYLGTKDINMGIHATMLDTLFSNQISKFYKENKNIEINIFNYDFNETLKMLNMKKLDIVVSKEVKNNYSNIKFIPIGKLHDVLITSKNGINKISLEELKEEILYMPRLTSVSPANFFKSIKQKEENFNIKHVPTINMIKMIKSSNAIGLMTKEYAMEELKNKEIKIVKTDFEINEILYGIYINKNNMTNEIKKLIDYLR